MTKTQEQQFNRMRNALLRISKDYMTPDQIRRDSEKRWGLDYEESLEMSYENIQNEARMAVKGVRSLEAKLKIVLSAEATTAGGDKDGGSGSPMA